jgi:hypothetical protein
VDISPDPQVSISRLVPQSPEIATIRIISLSDFSEVTIIQDYREKSIPKGFATIGGLWTFLGGVFTALFGSSIMRILFGSFLAVDIIQKLCSCLIVYFFH